MTKRELMAAVRTAPKGLTARQVMKLFGVSRNIASARLSWLWSCGELKRDYIPGNGAGPGRGHCRSFRYLIQEAQ